MADVTGDRQTGAVLLIVVLALGAALLYGVADFMSGVAARRIPVLVATTINYAFATVVLVIVVFAVGGVWSNQAIVSGLVAGVLAAVGFLTFTGALAAGPISLMTPLIALLSSAVPVVVALVLGDRLEPIAWIAIGVAIVGSVLIGVERRVSARSAKPRTLVFAVISGVCFGFATVALDAAPAGSPAPPDCSSASPTCCSCSHCTRAASRSSPCSSTCIRSPRYCSPGSCCANGSTPCRPPASCSPSRPR